MGVIQVGRVSTRKGARLHATVNGRAACPVRPTLILGAPRPLKTSDADQVCKRCLPALVAQLAQTVQDCMGGGHGQARTDRLRVADVLLTALRPDPEVADLAARFDATVQAAPAVMDQPQPARARTWADLRAGFMATHPQILKPRSRKVA